MSSTAEYYRSNPAARKRRHKQQARFNRRPAEKRRRVELNRINRQNHRNGKSSVGDGKDVSHMANGSTKLENASSNRKRNVKLKTK